MLDDLKSLPFQEGRSKLLQIPYRERGHSREEHTWTFGSPINHLPPH